ncbi:MAG: DNA-binding protein [Aliifodinibius sp.]|nr:DNA-binding protein [Fodinibius sp.]NIV15899.1 DNA-binding protein [Fodinibius sp.]NIY29854.1 DNA-binding protein [Fodinibius sp.]
MKQLIINITLFFIIAPLITTAFGQQRSGKNKKKQMYYREFNTSTIETIEGEVLEITYNPSKATANKMGVHMTVKTDKETIPVHLGPAWYLEQQEKINEGDKIKITGSRITFENNTALIASEIKRGNMTLQLRNKKGIPVWKGWKQNTRMN